nr:histidine kinase [uncultured Flavobacterium sp.]
MKIKPVYDTELLEVIVYTFLAFLLMGLVLILFFYFSRKKIIKNELEKKDMELQYQKELLRAMILTQEEERKRIAQDLHDDISSKLNIVSLNSHLLAAPEISEKAIAEITENIITLTNKALENSRRIAHDLLPPTLDNFGFHAGVEELCMEFGSSKAVVVNYENQAEFDDLEKDRHLHVFRILQELMNNSLRHGKATVISILFEEESGVKTCRYTDNGIGFDTDLIKKHKGIGLKNIESRIAFLEGGITINSALNQGIEVIFNF